MNNKEYPLTIPLEEDVDSLDDLLSGTCETRKPRTSLALSASSDWQDIEYQCEALDSANLQISSLTLSFPDFEESNPPQPLYCIKARPLEPSPSTSPTHRPVTPPSKNLREHHFLEAKPGRELGSQQNGDPWSSRCSTPDQLIMATDTPVAHRTLAQGRFLQRVSTEPIKSRSNGVRVRDPVDVKSLHHSPCYGLPIASPTVTCVVRGPEASSCQANDGNRSPLLHPTGLPLHSSPHNKYQPEKPALVLHSPLDRNSNSSLVSVSSIDSSNSEPLVPFSPVTPHSIEGNGSLYSGLYPQTSLDKHLCTQPRTLSNIIDTGSFKETGRREEREGQLGGFLSLPGSRKAPGTSRLSMEVSEKLKNQLECRPFGETGSAQRGTERPRALCPADIEEEEVEGKALARSTFKQAERSPPMKGGRFKLLNLAGDPVVRPFGRAGDPVLRRRGTFT